MNSIKQNEFEVLNKNDILYLNLFLFSFIFYFLPYFIFIFFLLHFPQIFWEPNIAKRKSQMKKKIEGESKKKKVN